MSLVGPSVLCLITIRGWVDSLLILGGGSCIESVACACVFVCLDRFDLCASDVFSRFDCCLPPYHVSFELVAGGEWLASYGTPYQRPCSSFAGVKRTCNVQMLSCARYLYNICFCGCCLVWYVSHHILGSAQADA